MTEKIKDNFKIAAITEEDAKDKTDNLKVLEELISNNEDMYPNIKEWYKKKVIDGLKSSERIAYVGYLNNTPVLSAVLKRGKNSKFCHLKIGKNIQNENLGEILFSLMTLEVRNYAKEIHFTLPESLWESKKEFFKSFGFENAVKHGIQYRLFDEELICSAPYLKVWNKVINKLPKLSEIFLISKYSMDNKLIMSIKPEFAKKIICGKKTVEIRRKFAEKWTGHKVNLYSSKPISGLVGEAKIDRVDVGKPDYIWELYYSNIGCNKKEFDFYTNSLEKIYAIVLDEIRPYETPIPLSQISYLINEDLRPPQSYFTTSKNKNWSKAVSIAALLHGSLKKQKLNLV